MNIFKASATRYRSWIPVAAHIVAWALFFVLPGINNPMPDPGGTHGGMQRYHPPPAAHTDLFWLAFSTLKNMPLLPLLYLNVLYLLPGLMRAGRYRLLAVVEIVLAMAIFGWTQAMSGLVFPGTNGGPHKYASVVAYLIVLSAAFAYHSYSEALRVEKTRKERETEALKTELQFLRWQISPHFLFNALNNMVALARKKSDALEPMLISLSGMMRYMLYETSESVVSLLKEAQYLRSFIALQSIRYEGVRIETHIEVSELTDYHIEPMLLIPFVENAFKHGIDGVEAPLIGIRLRVEEGTLLFSVHNKCCDTKPAPHDDAHGLGLANVRKRLALLYEGRHTLSIETGENFIVSLKIALT